ncbi:PDZ domain-containing protein 4-like [Scleropages formosus]|uniref:PDZ domain containing 4 n=1 Tax=Scleropages formosus TaxID=113540 RepID=A0A8C9WBD7_SCLFO|nr:PDZ domain-containing protein 4 [Scleropages formosus]
MGCNMCVVQRPEEQCRVMFQVNGKDVPRLNQEQTLEGLRASRGPLMLRKGPRRKNGAAGGGPAAVAAGPADCVDSGTQTDISFQHVLPLSRANHPRAGAPHSSLPLPPILEPYELNELPPLEHEYYDANDYFDVAQHEVDRQDELEYEEVELYKSRQQDKLGLTVCYRTDDEEDLGIYVGEVNPNSIAAKDGRIREGDRILQINGVDIQNREEAVAILTREDSTNISLLLARPEIEKDNQLDPDELDLELQAGLQAQALESSAHLPSPYRLMNGGTLVFGGRGGAGTERRGWSSQRDAPVLRHTVLNNSQELDSGVGRTDESTRNEESSEHDLLGDDQTSASNTPGSMRKFRASRGDTPPLLRSREFHFSTDSLPGLEGGVAGGGYSPDPVTVVMMPGLTEEECERYRELLEIKCFYEKNGTAVLAPRPGMERGHAAGRTALDVNRNEGAMQHELALLEEELRHLEFKCRNILRAQKMQQLRERCMRAWPLEEEEVGAAAPGSSGMLGNDDLLHHELSDITELPEREKSDKESTSAYNTGGESCRSTPLASEHFLPATPSSRMPGTHRERGGKGQATLNHSYMSSREQVEGKGPASLTTKFRSLSQDGCTRRPCEGSTRRSPKASSTLDRGGGRSAETSPYFSRRQRGARLPECYHSCEQLKAPSVPENQEPKNYGAESQPGSAAGGGDEHCGPPSTCKDTLNSFSTPVPDFSSAPAPLPLPPASPRMEWKVKVRSDGSRYVAKRPVRDRLLKARAMKIREERSGMTTDDDAVSEMKMGRYWSKEERKQQLMRAREYRRRREFMMQSRLDCLREREQQSGAAPADCRGTQQGMPQEATILELSQRKSMRKRNRKILDNWITIQELLAHGTRSPDGKKIYNPLLSVTTV